MCKGWIKIHRGMLEWEWYDDNNTKILFLHLLLKANHKEKSYRGQLVKVGQLITGLDVLSKETGLSIQKIRTAISKLKSTNEITIKTSAKGSIIQVVKYKDYQQATSDATDNQQASNKQTTTNNNVNNEKNEISIDWDSLKNHFNMITNKDTRVVSNKAKDQIRTRFKEGYTKEDLITAIKNCYNNSFHQEKENRHFLTLTFISRPDKFETYLNAEPIKEKPAAIRESLYD